MVAIVIVIYLCLSARSSIRLNTRDSIRRARSHDHGLRVDINKGTRKSTKSHDSSDGTVRKYIASRSDL